METWLIIAIGLFVFILISKGVRIVPQAENWIVERFGKYATTLKAGLNIINPIFSRVVAKIDIREKLLDLPKQGIITSDNANVEVDGIVYYKVLDPYKAYYGISSLEFAIANLAQTTIRSIMGKLSLDESLSSRDRINEELLKILDEATDSWGTKITRVEIKDIKPPKDLTDAMALQMKAERERRARILEAEAKKQAMETEAEGYKRAQILESEARKESAIRDAEARERLAQAEANALKMVAEVLKVDPSTYLLGQKYVEGLIKLSSSPNSKFILIPSDIMNSIKNILKSS
ncbi:MAG TPA: SPFH domain-containing protein [Spirochaetota bacterium]|nr:SPFH domain-containing protein [Spirochaetota bacterium]HOM39183.1 SPFH domain-containing protein [Spirochaetota bacterium]HPQ50037.1 SPFH domain-containing protein [Spirochaetota bacterium]